MSKITSFVAVLGLMASVSVAQAGGKAEPYIEPEPEVVTAAPVRSGSALPIILGLLLLGGVAAGGGSTSGTP